MIPDHCCENIRRTSRGAYHSPKIGYIPTRSPLPTPCSCACAQSMLEPNPDALLYPFHCTPVWVALLYSEDLDCLAARGASFGSSTRSWAMSSLVLPLTPHYLYLSSFVLLQVHGTQRHNVDVHQSKIKEILSIPAPAALESSLTPIIDSGNVNLVASC
jgi:hypothetical protein